MPDGLSYGGLAIVRGGTPGSREFDMSQVGGGQSKVYWSYTPPAYTPSPM
ncbi:hypothetical protein ACFSLT_11385 [Novosphingobium resinovorum]